MGLFAHWVCVKGPADALREASFGRVVETETPGWLAGYPDEDAQLPEWEEFDELVARVAAAAGAPAVGSWVYDSDVGYLAAVDERRGIARLVINPDAGDAYDLPVPEGWPDGAIAGFAAWSSGAPKALDASAIEGGGARLDLRGEGVQDLHERLGLRVPYEAQPDISVPTPLARATVDVDVGADELAGFVRPLEVLPTLRLIMRELPWREARYIAGTAAISSASGIASDRARRSSASPRTTPASCRRTTRSCGSRSKRLWRAPSSRDCDSSCRASSRGSSSSRWLPTFSITCKD